METEHQQQVAFYLTGKKSGAGLDAIEGLGLRPVLFANYRDLTRLRHDCPLVLVRGATEGNFVQSLSGVVDAVLHEISGDEDGERVTQHVLRLEHEIRARVAAGESGALTQLWDRASSKLAAGGDPLLRDSLSRARAALKTDGDVVDCGVELPSRLLTHAWSMVQAQKALSFQEYAGQLILKLANIVRADFVHSQAGQQASSLEASVGGTYESAFDFEVMSRLLTKAAPRTSLPEKRRRRIESALAVLESQKFFPLQDGNNGNGVKAHEFAFGKCDDVLAAIRARQRELIEVAKAIEIAEFEVNGRYVEAKHDAFFESFGEEGLDPKDLARFPDYLLCLGADRLQASEQAELMEILSSGLPVKILLQSDDILERQPQLALGLRAKQLADMAMGLNDVYVMQASAALLFQFRQRLLKGLSYPGPALFSVFSGAALAGVDVPPYLIAAAAMDSRAFPAFSFDPSAGSNLASRFQLEANAQLDVDWPLQSVVYENGKHERVSERLAFTLLDFLACDPRHARHFARVPRSNWSASLVPVGEFLAREPRANGQPDKVPCLWMIDSDGMLQKLIVDEKLIREACRCREEWHRLQELGGIHNSHAERLLVRQRAAWEARERAGATAAPAASAQAPAPLASIAAETKAAKPAAETKAAPASDEAYIETPRCTSCDECTHVSNKMFAYDANKQAYIANRDAGTYAQLVEAAESCQVAIIHPGKPWNPNEPGLAELLVRAEPFR